MDLARTASKWQSANNAALLLTVSTSQHCPGADLHPPTHVPGRVHEVSWGGCSSQLTNISEPTPCPGSGTTAGSWPFVEASAGSSSYASPMSPNALVVWANSFMQGSDSDGQDGPGSPERGGGSGPDPCIGAADADAGAAHGAALAAPAPRRLTRFGVGRADSLNSLGSQEEDLQAAALRPGESPVASALPDPMSPAVVHALLPKVATRPRPGGRRRSSLASDYLTATMGTHWPPFLTSPVTSLLSSRSPITSLHKALPSPPLPPKGGGPTLTSALTSGTASPQTPRQDVMASDASDQKPSSLPRPWAYKGTPPSPRSERPRSTAGATGTCSLSGGPERSVHSLTNQAIIRGFPGGPERRVHSLTSLPGGLATPLLPKSDRRGCPAADDLLSHLRCEAHAQQHCLYTPPSPPMSPPLMSSASDLATAAATAGLLGPLLGSQEHILPLPASHPPSLRARGDEAPGGMLRGPYWHQSASASAGRRRNPKPYSPST